MTRAQDDGRDLRIWVMLRAIKLTLLCAIGVLVFRLEEAAHADGGDYIVELGGARAESGNKVTKVSVYTHSMGVTVAAGSGDLKGPVVFVMKVGDKALPPVTFAASDVETRWLNHASSSHPHGAWFEVATPSDFATCTLMITVGEDKAAVMLGPYKVEFDTTEYDKTVAAELAKEKSLIDFLTTLGFNTKGWKPGRATRVAGNLKGTIYMGVCESLIAEALAKSGGKEIKITLPNSDDALKQVDVALAVWGRYLKMDKPTWPAVFAAVQKAFPDGEEIELDRADKALAAFLQGKPAPAKDGDKPPAPAEPPKK